MDNIKSAQSAVESVREDSLVDVARPRHTPTTPCEPLGGCRVAPGPEEACNFVLKLVACRWRGEQNNVYRMFLFTFAEVFHCSFLLTAPITQYQVYTFG